MAAGIGLFTVCAGAAILAGWALGWNWLKRIRTDWVSMMAITAVAFILSGAALLLEAGRRRREASGPGLWGKLMSAGAAALGAATLLEFAGWPLGIDLWLFPEAARADIATLPGRMAALTALCFVLLGTSLSLPGGPSRWAQVRQWLALSVLGIASAAGLGYLYAGHPASGIGSGTPMAIPTLILFILLGAGTSALEPDSGLLGLLRRRDIAGTIARRFIPAAVAIPLIIGWLGQTGEEAGLFEPRLSQTIVIMTFIVVFGLVISWTARSLGRADGARKRTEESLRASEERFRLATAAAKIGIWDRDVEADRLTWDDRMYELFGLERADFPNGAEAWSRGLHPDDRTAVEEERRKALAGEKEYETTFRVIRPEGTIRHIKAFGQVIRGDDGRPVRMIGINFDVTPIVQAEQERGLAIDFLRLVNETTGTANLVRAAAAFFRERSGCQAVGIRLKDDEDYPYYEASGFSPEFIAAENYLCSRGPDGELVKDEKGRPYVECMCGNVIEGRFDPAQPFFTPKGTFWTNSTTRLLASTTDAERQTRTRNRCNEVGYESMILTPLRTGGVVLGLLQLNDRRTGMFTHGTVALWERLADYLAVALAKSRAEEDKGALEGRYSRLFEFMVEGFAYCRMFYEGDSPRDFVYLAVNPAFEAQTGLKDVVGKAVSEVIPGIRESDAGLFEIYGRVARTGVPERFEMDVKALGMWFSVSVYSPERDHFVAVFDDISRRKKAEAEIRELNAELENRVRQRTTQLEAANQDLEAFSYSISHDLRAPLRGINGWSAALEEEYGDRLDGRARSYLDRVRAESVRMSRLIDDLLRLSRTARGEIARRPVDLSAVAETVAARMREAYPGRRLDFAIRPKLRVEGDPALLEVVLTNLFDNACKFTGHRPAARIAFGKVLAGGEPAFFVRDNGVGFDMAYAEKLFGVFQRMHVEEDFPGTGIGLATTRRIIRKHGGRIWAEAEPDKGATFYFTLGGAG